MITQNAKRLQHTDAQNQNMQAFLPRVLRHPLCTRNLWWCHNEICARAAPRLHFWKHCQHIYIYIYIYTYTHTHTHKHVYFLLFPFHIYVNVRAS
jgi:hypothetical protein